MHNESIEAFRHDHVFLGADHARNERRTWAVIGLCGLMMAAEISGGVLFGSMALIADGLHMSTHAGAMLIAAGAYAYARRHMRDERFVFGTGKLGDLAAFTSAMVLALIALLIGVESIVRLLHPIPIAFDQAILLAAVGLCVNIASAWLLRGGNNSAHEHDNRSPADEESSPDHHHHHHDLNLRAAYVHVLADAAVSILAVIGLVAGRQLGWIWMDPTMGIVGACVIANWSWGLVRSAGAVLLDLRLDPSLATAVRKRLERNGDRISDLHLWRIGPGHAAVVVSVVSERPQPPASYKELLAGLPYLSHVTVEVETCPGPH